MAVPAPPPSRRTPSASERVIEEALSAARRLLERLVRSARLHGDAAFLPPPSCFSPSSCSTIRCCHRDHGGGGGGYSGGVGSAAGRGDNAKLAQRAPSVTGVPGSWGKSAAEDGHAYHGAAASYYAHVDGCGGGEESRRRRAETPGDAAVATLLSFRYPQSTIVARPPVPDTATATTTAAAGGSVERLALGGGPGSSVALIGRDGSVGERGGDIGGGDGGGGGGLSVCGALFALFLSVCPLLGHGGPNSGSGRTVNEARYPGAAEAAEEGEMARTTGRAPSRVAVLAGEVLRVSPRRATLGSLWALVPCCPIFGSAVNLWFSEGFGSVSFMRHT